MSIAASDRIPDRTDALSWAETRQLIRSDLQRATGRTDDRALLAALARSSNTRFLVVLRVGSWAASSPRRLALRMVCSALHRRWASRYGLEIPFATQIGPGLHINHRIGGIMVTRRARLGSGLTLSPGVVIGKVPGRPGSPVIGDDVTLSVGAKVIGDVSIGDGVLVGANAVVTQDLPAGVTAGGVPARVLGRAGDATCDDDLDRAGHRGPR